MVRPQDAPLELGKTALIDVVVLVFARSRLRDVVGTDALKMLLSGSHRELFPEPRTLTLQPVWELLESQAGFDPELATPPLCRLKLLEDKLQIAVRLPVALAALDRAAIEARATECMVTFAEVDKVIAPPRTTTPPPLRAIEVVSISQPSASSGSSRAKLAAVAAVIGLGAAGVSAYFTFYAGDDSGDHSTQVPPAEISRDIPLREVRLEGTSLLGVLADPKWSIQPEALRRRQLEDTAPAVRAHGGTTLIVVDPGGIPAGSLLLIGKPTVMFSPTVKPTP